MTTPKEAFLAAEKDPHTKTIVYFGELGGTDEYELSEMLKDKQITKQVICYIAGSVAEMFDTPPQFGHAKALAQKHEETAVGKREMLKKAGAKVADSYSEFLEMIKLLPASPYQGRGIDSPPDKGELEGVYATIGEDMSQRQPALITTSIFSEKDGLFIREEQF